MGLKVKGGCFEMSTLVDFRSVVKKRVAKEAEASTAIYAGPFPSAILSKSVFCLWEIKLQPMTLSWLP